MIKKPRSVGAKDKKNTGEKGMQLPNRGQKRDEVKRLSHRKSPIVTTFEIGLRARKKKSPRRLRAKEEGEGP